MIPNFVVRFWTRTCFRRSRRTFVASAFLVVAATLGSAGRSFGADSVRAILLDADGSPVEKTLEGTFESISADAIVFVDASGNKTTLPTDAILWTRFDGEPLEFAAVRAETENGEFDAALEKLAAISKSELNALRKSNPNAALEFDWLKAEATARKALFELDSAPVDVEKNGKKTASAAVANAAKLLQAFIKKGAEHYRYFEANALTGEIATKLGRPDDAKPFFQRLADSNVPTIRARGQIALGDAALDAKKFDEAQAFFDDALKAAELSDGNAETLGEFATGAGTNVRILARLGIARVLAERGEIDVAEKAFAETIAETPNFATLLSAKIYNALGSARANAGKTKEAIVAYLHVELLYRQATSERVRALQALAELWEKAGRPDRASEAKKTLQTRFGVEI